MIGAQVAFQNVNCSSLEMLRFPQPAAVPQEYAETLRKIETGRIPTPSFTTVALLASEVGLSLDAIWRARGFRRSGRSPRPTPRRWRTI
jgi:hypothetical protein